ncbi:N-6 DNA methylase [Brevibacillus sp. GCM10020057]|uniref:N-6 DNA methylase n=1 Tax=Brevibacillus sp. GCM10020057 TaxID=3317327 RepID=UPI00363305B7
MDLRTEEDVKIKAVLPYLKERGFEESMMDFEKSIVVQEGRKQKTIFADIVVYLEKSKKTPIVLVETKAPTEVIGKAAREQAISYARLLDKIAPYAVVSNGLGTQVYHSITKDRLGDLPNRKEITKDIVSNTIGPALIASLQKEAKHELFIIDDVQTFKKVLKNCHNIIRNNEGYDPVQAFDELSKVLFCKMYEEFSNTQNNRFRLSIFDDFQKSNVNIVRTIFSETVTNPRYEGLFRGDETILLHDRTIREIVASFEGYDLSLTAFDVKGEAFEFFLSDTFTGGLGEFFTPRNVVEFIVDAIDPKIGDKIVDPFCGTGGFLIYAFEVISEKIRLQDFSDDQREAWQKQLSEESLFGTDWKERTAQACKMNMIVHGDGHNGIYLHHGLENIEGKIEEGKFNLCLTNPPFGSIETDKKILNKYDLGKGRESQTREILAIERAIRLIKPGGKIGIVMIHGLLGNESTQYVRNYILKTCQILGIITLNEDTFRGYNAGVRTSILFLEKKKEADDGSQKPIFMSVCQNTGYSPTGQEIPGNELPDILMRYQEFMKNKKLEKTDRLGFLIESIGLGARLDPPFYWANKEDFDRGKVSENVVNTWNELTNAFNYADQVKESLKIAIKQNEVVNGQDLVLKTVKLSDLLIEVKRPVKLDPDTTYSLLGVKWYAKGAFLRENKLGREIKASTLFRVETGDLIYNRLFGFKGTFAMIGDDLDGCYVSNEFPLFVVRDNVNMDRQLLAKYLLLYFSNPKFWENVERVSTGSTTTSRLRLNQKVFLNMQVNIPSNEEDLQKSVTRLQAFIEATNQITEAYEKIRNLLEQSGESLLRLNFNE